MTNVTNSDYATGTAVRRQAASASIAHAGPTATRYQDAMNRFLGAVASSVSAAEPGSGGAAAPVDSPVRTVGDVMTKNVVTAHEGAVFKEIVDAIVRNRISAVPVIDTARRVLGVVSEADLLARIAGSTGTPPRGDQGSSPLSTQRKAHAATAAELMTSPAVTTTPATTVLDAAIHAARSRVRRLPVVDAAGTLVGIVTRGDLVKVFLRADQDVLADITNRIASHQPRLAQAIHVEVHEGVARLHGAVDTPAQAAQICALASEIAGVVDVRSELRPRSAR